MQRLEVSGVVRHIYRSLGVKGLIPLFEIAHIGQGVRSETGGNERKTMPVLFSCIYLVATAWK